MSAALTTAERVLVLTTSPHVTEVMRTACTDLVAEHADLMDLARCVRLKFDATHALGKMARACIAKAEGA